jgi:hypothetical protein
LPELQAGIAQQPFRKGGLGYLSWHKTADPAFLASYVHASLSKFRPCSQIWAICFQMCAHSSNRMVALQRLLHLLPPPPPLHSSLPVQ